MDKINKSELFAGRVEPDIGAAIKAIANQRGIRKSALVREALTEFAKTAKSADGQGTVSA